MSNIREIVMRVSAVLDAVALQHPSFPFDQYRELVQYNEPGIAVENLCDNLHENDLRLHADTHAVLMGVAVDLGIDGARLDAIEQLNAALQ